MILIESVFLDVLLVLLHKMIRQGDVLLDVIHLHLVGLQIGPVFLLCNALISLLET